MPGRSIGRRLRLVESGGLRGVLFGSTAIHVFDASDREAEAACIATLSRAGLASDVEIAAAFGVHRNTVGRLVARFEHVGMAAVVPAKRGPKGASKLTLEVTALIAGHAGQLPGWRLRDLVAERTGVSLSLSYVCRLAAEHRGVQLELSDPGADNTDPDTQTMPDAAPEDVVDKDVVDKDVVDMRMSSGIGPSARVCFGPTCWGESGGWASAVALPRFTAKGSGGRSKRSGERFLLTRGRLR